MTGNIRNHAITVLICYSLATTGLIAAQFNGWRVIPPAKQTPSQQELLEIFDTDHRKGK